MKKVLHVFREFKFSGAEIMYADAADLFIDNQIELYALSTVGNGDGEFTDRLKKAGYKLFHKNYPNKLNFLRRLRFYAWLVSFLKQNSINVIHIHSSDCMWGFSLCAWLSGVKSIYTFHNVFRSSNFIKYLYNIFLRQTSKKIFRCTFQTISDSVYDNELFYYKNKTIKVFNWYNDKRFYPATSDEKKIMRSKMNISQNALVLISIGGCSHIKRHEDILYAIDKLKYYFQDILYLHLGDGATHAYEKKLALELKIDNHVRFLGNKDAVREYLVCSDFYIMPSKFEGIPITTIEALATGIPAILYNVPGLKDFNKNEEVTCLIGESVDLIVESVKKLVLDDELKLLYKRRGIQFVNDFFNMKTNAKSIVELYDLNN